MEFKKYIDIERIKEKYANVFTKGEHITITEKIDGSNASIWVENGEVKAGSRKQVLRADNTLNGFYDFVMTLPADILKDILEEKYIIFGEWLVKHTVKYPEDKLKTFYVFDVWNRETEQYMPWVFTKQIAEFLGLKLVPLFYDGEFTSWEEHMKLVGKTEMGGEPCGEGIVIKSQDRLDNKFSGTPAYLKIVAEKFSEVHDAHPKKPVDPETLAKREADKILAETIVTERRVVKCIEKFIDNGEFPAEWDEKNLGQLAKILPKAVYADCVKEEPETVEQIEGFGKICGSLTMQFARGLIK